MTRYEIESELDKLYKDLEFAHNADEQTVCRVCNADSKQEYIRLLTDDIDTYESLLQEFEPLDDGMDYANLQLSQGLAITHW